LEALIPEAKLEDMLAATKPMALSPAKKQICYGSAWGKLENLRREKNGETPVCAHLDFGELTDEQTPWFSLMENGTMAQDGDKTLPPVSWMLQKEWTNMLEKSSPCHEKYLHLAAVYMAERNLRDADEALTEAMNFAITPIALFLKAQIHRMKGDISTAADTALEAYRLLPSDVSLARQSLALALRAGKHDEIIKAYESAPANVQADGRVSMTYAFALLRTGNISAAEAILLRDGGLSVTDIREGEISLTSLYIEIQKAKAAAEGKSLEDADIDVPRQFDFRMFVPKKK
jgi:tetratricopeptide (TPR) repeat protein